MRSIPTSTAVTLIAGAATVDITPQGSVFLFGYPHVARYSTGLHDRLESSALYLQSGGETALFISNDLIFVGKELAAQVRRRISIKTGIPICAIAVTATHTHSGPATVDYLSNGADTLVPKADAAYLEWVTACMVEVGYTAVRTAVPAESGLAVAHADGVGSNRHHPEGPSDPEVPVLVVRSARDQAILGCMVVYGMHPTVLHEDSTLISADFPHFTRQYLREAQAIPAACPILYHMGASGDQSPRHMTRANTFAEAKRLGERLGRSIEAAMATIEFTGQRLIDSRRVSVDLKLREFPPTAQAVERAQQAKQRLEQLRRDNAVRTAIRTAECDWFGAEEMIELSRAAADGRLARAAQACAPAEIQLIVIGPWKFVMWPGEFFVEYALEVKKQSPRTFIITCANGELQGYVATPEAENRRYYEASNAIFSASNGAKIVAATLKLLTETT